MDDTTTLPLPTFGDRITTLWRGMRPTTRRLVERALAADTNTNTTSLRSRPSKHLTPYDANAESELSDLLSALDARLAEGETHDDLRRMTETCARVLQAAAQSADSFALLLARALRLRDYAAIDLLADALTAQLPPSEICELTRHTEHAISVVAEESLAHLPVSVLVELFADPVDEYAARRALETQARDYESEEARWVLDTLGTQDLEDMDF